MPWCNGLQRAGSEFFVNDNFPVTFVDFRLKKFQRSDLQWSYFCVVVLFSVDSAMSPIMVSALDT